MKKKHISKFLTIVVILTIIYLFGSKIGFLPKQVDYCNGMLGLDYNAAVDGPYNYVALPTFKTIAKCGGYCMAKDCSNICPPDSWTCK